VTLIIFVMRSVVKQHLTIQSWNHRNFLGVGQSLNSFAQGLRSVGPSKKRLKIVSILVYFTFIMSSSLVWIKI